MILPPYPNTPTGRLGSLVHPSQLSHRTLSGATAGAASLPPVCPWQHVPPPDGRLRPRPCSSPSTTASPSWASLSSPHFGLLHPAALKELLGPTLSFLPALPIPHGLPTAPGLRGLRCQQSHSNGKGPGQSLLGGHGSIGERVSNPQHIPSCHASIPTTFLHPCTFSRFSSCAEAEALPGIPSVTHPPHGDTALPRNEPTGQCSRPDFAGPLVFFLAQQPTKKPTLPHRPRARRRSSHGHQNPLPPLCPQQTCRGHHGSQDLVDG